MSEPTETDRAESGLIYSGYADADAPAHRGWLLGDFMPPGDPRQTGDVEIKLGPSPWRHSGTVGHRRVTDCGYLPDGGRFGIDLPDRSVVLDRPGAYAVFGGVGHSWEAEEDSLTIAVRWPSVPGF
jgi:hypothetical protein